MAGTPGAGVAALCLVLLLLVQAPTVTRAQEEQEEKDMWAGVRAMMRAKWSRGEFEYW